MSRGAVVGWRQLANHHPPRTPPPWPCRLKPTLVMGRAPGRANRPGWAVTDVSWNTCGERERTTDRRSAAGKSLYPNTTSGKPSHGKVQPAHNCRRAAGPTQPVAFVSAPLCRPPGTPSRRQALTRRRNHFAQFAAGAAPVQFQRRPATDPLFLRASPPAAASFPLAQSRPRSGSARLAPHRAPAKWAPAAATSPLSSPSAAAAAACSSGRPAACASRWPAGGDRGRGEVGGNSDRNHSSSHVGVGAQPGQRGARLRHDRGLHRVRLREVRLLPRPRR